MPWVDILKGDVWGTTRLPFNPFEFDSTHAQKGLDILEAMVRELRRLMPNAVTDDWLFEISIREKGANSGKKITIESMWGGYTPEQQDED